MSDRKMHDIFLMLLSDFINFHEKNTLSGWIFGENSDMLSVSEEIHQRKGGELCKHTRHY